MHLPKWFQRTPKKIHLTQSLEGLDELSIGLIEAGISSLSDEDKERIRNALKKAMQETSGDGKATLLEPMTDSEFAQWEHEQDRGWKKVYDKLLRREA